MSVEEILAKNTSNMSLNEMLVMLGSVDDQDAVYRLRKRHEEDSGVPMEEDDFGKGEQEVVELMMPEMCEKIEAAGRKVEPK